MLSSAKSKLAVAALSLSLAGVTAIATREGGFVRTGYLDPVGIPTACAGHTKTAVVGKKYTLSTCGRLLNEDTTEAQAAVKRLVKIKITQAQYDELTDFVFNVGTGNFASSTLLRKVNAGDCLGAGAEFPRWVYAKGQYLRGLENRRILNRKGWESGC